MGQGDVTPISWVEVPPDHDFPIQNLPYGVFETDGHARVGVALGDWIVDLAGVYDAGLFDGTSLSGANVFDSLGLNAFMAGGRALWREVRERLMSLLSADNPTLRDDEKAREKVLIRQSEARMRLPVEIGDFTDFYSSKYHATNVGRMFRPDNPLMPNWVHLPVGYHGRSSSIFVSGRDIHRPQGQTNPNDAPTPLFGPSRALDFELEMGFFVGTGNEPGRSIPIDRAADHIFGMCLVNDWSARDVQKWEYVPLGPFLSKSFATSISPWVVPLDALEPFRVPGPAQDPQPLPYLRHSGDGGYDIHLEVWLQSESMSQPLRVAASNFKHLYWTILQQLAHHTINGTPMRTGDLCGSGTVSGPTEDSLGCLLELCQRGTRPIRLPDGQERKFLQDGDTVIMKGWCQGAGYRVGFGEVRAKVLPAAE